MLKKNKFKMFLLLLLFTTLRHRKLKILSVFHFKLKLIKLKQKFSKIVLIVYSFQSTFTKFILCI